MKNATECATNFTALIDSLPAVEPSTAGADDDPIDLLVKSFLLWETTQEKADGAWDKIQAAIVDRNDLRVSMPHEVLSWIDAVLMRRQIPHMPLAGLHDVVAAEVFVDRLGLGR